MLEQLKSVRKWSWAAYGKHPSAKDFFRIGLEFPIAQSFVHWTESGYKESSLRNIADRRPVAWRFWSRGPGKENFVCGLVKDSSDSLGRQYPLLIVGSGHLEKWESCWDLLPFACEKTWEQAEYLSSHMFSDLKSLESEILNIRPPRPDWQTFELKSRKVPADKAVTDCECAANGYSPAGIPERSKGIMLLDGSDQFALINRLHVMLKKQDASAPNSIFMGGTFDQSYLVYFKRAISTGDFVQLWTPSLPEEAADEQANKNTCT